MKQFALQWLNRFLARTDASTRVHSTARLNRFVDLKNSSVGRYSYLGPRTRANGADIGSFSSISWDCFIGLESHDIDRVSTSPLFTHKHNGTGATWVHDDASERTTLPRTIVGNDVWLGARCMIMQGVEIGDGAVIGAGALVTKNVPPYSVMGGVPARHIRYRFSEDTILQLLERRWWDAPDQDIKDAITIFQKRNINTSDIQGLPIGK